MRLLEHIVAFLRQFSQKYVTSFRQTLDFSGIRDIFTPQIRDMKRAQKLQRSSRGKNTTLESNVSEVTTNLTLKVVARCPYCQSKDIVKKGHRKKKLETIQLYLCKDCRRVFNPQTVKGKSFPHKLIFDGLSLYNTGFTLEESCRLLKEQYGIEVKNSTLSDWVKEFEPLCRYSRLRPYALKLYSPHQIIQTVHLFHRQVYDFSVHRGKLALLLQEHKHAKFENLREFLEAVQAECPHQFFKEGERISEEKANFSLDEVILRKKNNFANRIAGLVLQSVSDNKLRHKTLQRFILCNDSVTVAVEVPVYMDRWDLEHLQDELGFKIPIKLEKVLTGHIDILQIRNGAIHILDYKPQAAKGKRSAAISQLTLYALALSRLTGLRLYDFKCAWFDEEDYFEFFPLHVVYKLRQRARKEDPHQMKFAALVDTEAGQKE